METSELYETVYEAITDALRAEGGGHDIRLHKRMIEGTVTFTDGEGRTVKELPIYQVFRKVTAVREKLRVLEQKVNNHPKLDHEEQAELQAYITKAYGSLTTLNFLFGSEDDKFRGTSA